MAEWSQCVLSACDLRVTRRVSSTRDFYCREISSRRLSSDFDCCAEDFVSMLRAVVQAELFLPRFPTAVDCSWHCHLCVDHDKSTVVAVRRQYFRFSEELL